MAAYAAYGYQSSHWDTARDSQDFIWLCRYCIGMVTGTPHDKIVPLDDFDPLDHFKDMLQALYQVLDHLRADLSQTVINDEVPFLCISVYNLVTTHPSFKLDLLPCVRALSAFGMPADELYDSGKWRSPQDALNELCAMYDLIPLVQ